MTKHPVPKIQVTKNYRLFSRSSDNRPTDAKKQKRLKEMMQKYGFLDCFPIVCRRDSNKSLIVVDGQHRLLFAEELGLPVYFIVTEQNFTTSDVNLTSRTWTIRDFAENFAENGYDEYREVLLFHETHGIPIGTSAAMLGGTTTYSNIDKDFVSGEFRIKDRDWAYQVAGLYTNLVALEKSLRSNRLIEACMQTCRVDSFDPKRMIQNAKRSRDKLVPYSTRDAYLDMLEEVYNYGRKSLIGLKAAATMAMRDRNPAINRKNGSK